MNNRFYNFKKKYLFYLFIVITFMIVGYATISTSLFTSGSTEISYDYENFKVLIDKVLFNGYVNSINNDNSSFSFTTNLSDELEENNVYVELFNDSSQYDSNIVLTCDTVSDETATILITNSEFRLNAKTKNVVNIKINKIGNFVNKVINCSFTVEGLETNELATSYEEVAPNSSEVLVKVDKNGDKKTLSEQLDELRELAKNR